MNSPSISKIKTFFQIHAIDCVYCISYLYWFYLAATSQMLIVWDADNYEKLATLIHDKGWVAYFQTGLNREPLYPFFISVLMRISNTISASYQSLVVITQLTLLGITQRL